MRVKACFVGLGSIGSRHLRNFRALCAKRGLEPEVHALRSGERGLAPGLEGLLSRQARSIEELDGDYDFAFVTNPTDRHFDAIRDLAARARSFFIEKPVFESDEHDLSAIPSPEERLYYVACPMRYTGVMGALEEIVARNAVRAVRAICSSYLPDWRPGTDYRASYSAAKGRGGGTSVDLIHEWDYLRHLFGTPAEVALFRGKYSALEISSEDVSVYIARYQDKLVELHLDYFGRKTRREVELYCDGFVAVADFIRSRVEFSDGRPALELPEDANDKYLRELGRFLDICAGEAENGNDMANALATLRLANGRVPEGTA